MPAEDVVALARAIGVSVEEQGAAAVKTIEEAFAEPDKDEPNAEAP
jgi:hypothetical protein